MGVGRTLKMKVEAAILTIQLQQPNLVARNLRICEVKK